MYASPRSSLSRNREPSKAIVQYSPSLRKTQARGLCPPAPRIRSASTVIPSASAVARAASSRAPARSRSSCRPRSSSAAAYSCCVWASNGRAPRRVWSSSARSKWPAASSQRSSVAASCPRWRATAPSQPPLCPITRQRSLLHEHISGAGEDGPLDVTTSNQVYGTPNETVLELIKQVDPGVPLIVKPNPLGGFTRSAALRTAVAS